MRHLESLSLFKIALQSPDPTHSTFTETFRFDPPDKTSLGTLCVVLQIYSNKARKENARLASEIAAYIKNEYLRNPGATTKTALSMTLKKTNSYFTRIQSVWRLQGLKMNLALCAYKNGQVHLCSANNGIILFMRGNKNFPIGQNTPSFRPESHRLFKEITTLPLKRDDRVVLTTPQIYRIQSALMSLNDEKALSSFIEMHKSELAHLGLIYLTLAPGKEALVQNKKDIRTFSFAFAKRRPVRIWGGIILILCIIALTFAATLAQRERIESSQEQTLLVEELTTSEKDARRLLQLGNVSEAEHVLSRMKAALSRLRQYEEGGERNIDRFSSSIADLEKALQNQKPPQ